MKERKGVAIAGAVLFLISPLAWFTRPSIAGIDDRAHEIVAEASEAAAPQASASATDEAAFTCVFNPQRSRVTVSETADVPLAWKADGCVNGRTQYGLGADGWSKVLAPGGEDAVTIASFDPATRTYRQDRYLLDMDTMGKVRAERRKYPAPACGVGEAEARKLGDAQAAVRAILPPQPNERMIYDCHPAP